MLLSPSDFPAEHSEASSAVSAPSFSGKSGDSLEATFWHDLTHNPTLTTLLTRFPALNLPHAWLVAGCLFQTIWNLQAGRPAAAGIKDYDLFYFDPHDLSEAAERAAQARADAVLGDLGVTVEVANQARVHLWYPSFFGRPYAALQSAEEGIHRFLVLETCVGVRPGRCLAPHGLAGIYAGTLTPNPLAPFPELFAAKAASYRSRWPALQMVDPAPGPAHPAARAFSTP